MLCNQDIRLSAKRSGVRLWQVADALGIREATLSRKLRYELPKAEKQKVLDIIETLAQERQEVG